MIIVPRRQWIVAGKKRLGLKVYDNHCLCSWLSDRDRALIGIQWSPTHYGQFLPSTHLTTGRQKELLEATSQKTTAQWPKWPDFTSYPTRWFRSGRCGVDGVRGQGSRYRKWPRLWLLHSTSGASQLTWCYKREKQADFLTIRSWGGRKLMEAGNRRNEMPRVFGLVL